MSSTGEVAVSGRHDFWVRSLRGWDIGFALMIAVAAVSVALVAPDLSSALVAVLGLAVLVAAYLLLGRPGCVRGDLRLTRAYLVALVAVVAFEVWWNDMGPVLLFLAYSHVWFFSTRRTEGVAWCVGLTVVFGFAEVAHDPSVAADSHQLAGLFGQVATGLIFAVALGLWVTWMSERSEERQQLVEQLSAAQSELAATHHASGVLAERARLAQEIHDTLAQGFTSVVMLAQAASAELERGNVQSVADRLGQVEDVARDNLAQARALVAAFGPPELETGTFADALTRLAARFEAETRIRVDCTGLDTVGPVGPEQAVVLLRSAQEALANVRKHSGARVVRLTVVRDGPDVRLEVTDDGRGLPPDAVEGFGLRGMRERVDAGGGTLEVGAAPGGGTRVSLTLPTSSRDAGTRRDDDTPEGEEP